MTGQIDHLVFATLMTLVTVLVGGVAMVIAWGKLFTDQPLEIDPRHSRSLYLFTAAVCVAPIGPLIALAFPGNLGNMLWNLSLIISFLCITACTVLIRNITGPGARTLWLGSVVLFLFDLIGLIGMIMALPGLPLNKG